MLYGPVWCFEVHFTSVCAESSEVMRFKEERVCRAELVLVSEDGRWECEICVEGAGCVFGGWRAFERGALQGYGHCWVKAGWFGKGDGVPGV